MNILTQFAVTISAGANNIPTTAPEEVIVNILNVTYFAAAIIAVIVIILAGLTFVTSNGNAAGVAKARNAILYSVVGLVIILAAFAITQFVIGSF